MQRRASHWAFPAPGWCLPRSPGGAGIIAHLVELRRKDLAAGPEESVDVLVFGSMGPGSYPYPGPKNAVRSEEAVLGLRFIALGRLNCAGKPQRI